MKASGSGYAFNRPSEIPPLRARAFEEDGHDPQRAEYNKQLWCSQDELLRSRDRQVEENIRMLHGQQWIVWSNLRGRFVNLIDTMEDDERRWRHMPVLNRLFLWFVLLHARMTENPPVISWNAGPDRIDQQLAEVADPVFKYLWRDTQMADVLDRLIGWMIPSGRAYLKSRIDPTKGDPLPQRGPATLGLLGPDGFPVQRNGQPIQRTIEDVLYATNPEDPHGEMVPAMRMVGADEDDYELQPVEGLEPESLYEGGIDVDVLMALEVRGEWGLHAPWHRKAWHMQKSLLTPLQAWETFGIELEPDVRGHEAENTAALWRLLQGSGLFGSTDSRRNDPSSEQEFVTVYESWHRPSRMKGTERTQESAGGRLLITTGGGDVLRDGVRPVPFRYTSPIRAFDFVGLPGRPEGTSPQEFLNGPVRTRNRLFAQKLGHATLASNPLRIVDSSQGLEEGQVSNVPGTEVVVDRSRSQNPPVEYVAVPAMGRDVDDAADRLRAEIDQLGQVSGSEATPPTEDSSGELVKELRFNSDRPIAATMKRMVTEIGRLAEDWMVMVPIVWDEERLVKISGEDNISRVVTVYPEMFLDGHINVEPEVESMLPEGRGERQERTWKFYTEGLFGPPGTPMAVGAFLDQARFPHMARMTRPGGADRATAEQNVGKLLMGAAADQIPMFPWYDHAIHQYVLEQFMKSPEYLKLSMEQQANFVAFWMKILDAANEAALLVGGRQLEVETELGADRLATQAALKPLSDAAGVTDAGAPPPRGRGPAGSAGADTAAA